MSSERPGIRTKGEKVRSCPYVSVLGTPIELGLVDEVGCSVTDEPAAEVVDGCAEANTYDAQAAGHDLGGDRPAQSTAEAIIEKSIEHGESYDRFSCRLLQGCHLVCHGNG